MDHLLRGMVLVLPPFPFPSGFTVRSSEMSLRSLSLLVCGGCCEWGNLPPSQACVEWTRGLVATNAWLRCETD